MNKMYNIFYQISLPHLETIAIRNKISLWRKINTWIIDINIVERLFKGKMDCSVIWSERVNELKIKRWWFNCKVDEFILIYILDFNSIILKRKIWLIN